MLDEKERKRLRDGLKGAATSVDLVLRSANPEDALSPLFEELVQAVESDAGDAVRVSRTEHE